MGSRTISDDTGQGRTHRRRLLVSSTLCSVLALGVTALSISTLTGACGTGGPGRFVNDPSFYPDFNGDGFADLLRYQNNLGERGRLERADRFILFGGPDVFSHGSPFACTAGGGCDRFGPTYDVTRISHDVADQAVYFLLGDVNGDGRSDVVAYNSWGIGDGTSAVFHGDAEVGLRDEPDYRLQLGSGITQRTVRALGDIDCDGFDDFTVMHRSDSLVIYLGGPAGASDDHTIGFALAGDHLSSHALGDIDGDGCDDMMLAGEVYLGAPGGPQPTGLRSGVPGLQAYHVVAPMDVNGDGLHDATVQDPALGLSILLGSADRTFLRVPLSFAHSSLIGDIDGDGISEGLGGGPWGLTTGLRSAANITEPTDPPRKGSVDLGRELLMTSWGPVGDMNGDGRCEYGLAQGSTAPVRETVILNGRRRVFDVLGDIVGIADYP